MSAPLHCPLPSIKEVLRLYRVHALKSLSQNFLLDLNLTNKIVKAAGNVNKGEVCEIGPGPGGITRSLLQHKPQKIIVIEKDQRFKPMLDNIANSSSSAFDIIYADIMGFDMSKMFDRNLAQNWNDSSPNIHLIGNLPFSVSTPLIVQWLKDISMRRSAWSYGRVKMTLTFQEEVAERMVALPFGRQRCRLSVMCQNWCDVTYKFVIPGKVFLPAPKVNVGVVHLEPLREPVIPLKFKLIEKVLKTLFSSRQKYWTHTVRNLFPISMREDFTKKIIDKVEISSTKRSFQLSIEEWKMICHAYKELCDVDPRIFSYDYRGKCSGREIAWMEENEEDEIHEEKVVS